MNARIVGGYARFLRARKSAILENVVGFSGRGFRETPRVRRQIKVDEEDANRIFAHANMKRLARVLLNKMYGRVRETTLQRS